MEERREKMHKEDRFELIAAKKKRVQENITKKDNLYAVIPKTEEQRIKEEIRKEENLELSEMKKNLWKKWQGKSRVLDNKTEIPTDADRIQEKMRKIEQKIKEYTKRGRSNRRNVT